ncbi:MAG: DinB family protein [Propionicimonas sp.]|uniref:DinB family protein n=1 Tax=Propionicimonas sp. TaxID=1955623 RepID=UPI003D0A2A3F
MTWTAPDVVRDEFPLDLPERDALAAFITWHRQTLLFKVSGLTGEQLASRPIPSTGLSLLGIVRHMAEVEHHWWRVRVAGEPVPSLYDEDEEWTRVDPVGAEADYRQLVDGWAAVDATAARFDLDHTFGRRGELWSVRTLYLHLVEEWARHNGHADLIREAIDGATGE